MPNRRVPMSRDEGLREGPTPDFLPRGHLQAPLSHGSVRGGGRAKAQPSSSTSRTTPYVSESRDSDRHLHAAFTAASLHELKDGNHWLVPDGGVDTQEAVHACAPMSSSSKGSNTVAQATAWMDLQDCMPREVSQTRKDKYCMMPLI